jgi:hypothetical protein
VILCTKTKNKSKLDFPSLPGNKLEVLTIYLSSVIKTHCSSHKFLGFCGDNCNTEFGGVKLPGEKQCLYPIKKGNKKKYCGIEVYFIVSQCG